MWILGADADEAAGTASIETITGLVTQNGGEMVDAEAWGRRSLSFPIKRNKEGSYFLAHFKMDQTQAPAFERALNANQDIVRYLLTIPDTRKPKKEGPRRSGQARADAAAAAAAAAVQPRE